MRILKDIVGIVILLGVVISGFITITKSGSGHGADNRPTEQSARR